MLDEEEFARWLGEARSTFEAIDNDIKGKKYNWACFKAHQAAEIALKGLLWGSGLPAFGHSVKAFLELVEKKLGLSVPTRIKNHAIRLDKFYVPTRYANQWASGSPHEYFIEEEAREAKSSASKLIGFVERCWKLLRKG
jgi:HEPN domain-containing protein